VEPRSTSSISTRLSGGAQLPSSVIVRRRRSPVALPTVSSSSQTPTPATNIDALTISDAGETAEFEFQLRQCQRHFILVDNFIIDSFLDKRQTTTSSVVNTSLAIYLHAGLQDGRCRSQLLPHLLLSPSLLSSSPSRSARLLLRPTTSACLPCSRRSTCIATIVTRPAVLTRADIAAAD